MTAAKRHDFGHAVFTSYVGMMQTSPSKRLSRASSSQSTLIREGWEQSTTTPGQTPPTPNPPGGISGFQIPPGLLVPVLPHIAHD